MNVLLMSLMYPQGQIAEISQNAKDGLQNQINNYQKAFIEGIKENLQTGEMLSIVNALPVGIFPKYYRKAFLKGSKMIKHVQELGCINLPWLKQEGRRIGATRALLDWVQSDPKNRTVLLYTLYLPYMQAVAAVKRKFPNLRAAVIVTDLPNELGISSGRRGLLKKLEYAMGSNRIKYCEDFDGFVLLTQPMAEVLPIQDKKQLVMEGLITQGTQEYTTESGGGNKPFATLYTGTLNRELGIAELLEAFIELPECELWLCGKGDMELAVQKAATEHPNIRYFGFVSQEKALELQASATLLINPRSPAGIFTRYSFPSKTLEYLRSGKPVVCYRLEGIPVDYDPYLYYIDRWGAEGIRQTICSLLALPAAELAKRGQIAQIYVQEHKNPCVQCKRILAMLREL